MIGTIKLVLTLLDVIASETSGWEVNPKEATSFSGVLTFTKANHSKSGLFLLVS